MSQPSSPKRLRLTNGEEEVPAETVQLVSTDGDDAFQQVVKASIARCKQELSSSLKSVTLNTNEVIYFVIDTSSSIGQKEKWCYAMALQRIRSSMNPTGIFVLVTFSNDMDIVSFGGEEMYTRNWEEFLKAAMRVICGKMHGCTRLWASGIQAAQAAGSFVKQLSDETGSAQARVFLFTDGEDNQSRVMDENQNSIQMQPCHFVGLLRQTGVTLTLMCFRIYTDIQLSTTSLAQALPFMAGANTALLPMVADQQSSNYWQSTIASLQKQADEDHVQSALEALGMDLHTQHVINCFRQQMTLPNGDHVDLSAGVLAKANCLTLTPHDMLQIDGTESTLAVAQACEKEARATLKAVDNPSLFSNVQVIANPYCGGQASPIIVNGKQISCGCSLNNNELENLFMRKPGDIVAVCNECKQAYGTALQNDDVPDQQLTAALCLEEGEVVTGKRKRGDSSSSESVEQVMVSNEQDEAMAKADEEETAAALAEVDSDDGDDSDFSGEDSSGEDSESSSDEDDE